MCFVASSRTWLKRICKLDVLQNRDVVTQRLNKLEHFLKSNIKTQQRIKKLPLILEIIVRVKNSLLRVYDFGNLV